MYLVYLLPNAGISSLTTLMKIIEPLLKLCDLPKVALDIFEKP